MLWTRLTGGSCSGAVARVENPELDEGPSSIRSSVEHAKLNPVFMQVCEEDGLTEGGKLVQDAIAQYTAVSKCSECGQSIKTKDQKKKKWPVMVRAIWRCYKGELIQAALWKLGWSIAIVTAIAYFIRNILLYINSNGVDTRLNEGIYLVTFFGVVIILLTIFLQQCMFISARLGIKIQAAITTQIYVKALKRADGTGSKADIVAMVAKDCRKIADAVSSLQFLWSGVFEAIVIFAILLAFTEYNALPAVAVFCFLLPCQYKLGLWIAHKKAEISGKSSERAQLTEEILRAMKLIKTYAWEDSFIEKLTAVRDQEVALYGRQTFGKTFLIASVFQMPPLFVMAIFGVYQINNPVTSALAFTTLTLFNTLRLPLVKLPKSLRDCTDAFLAMERIERYLLEPEIDSATNGAGVWSAGSGAGSASTLPRSGSGMSISMAPGVVIFENASFGHQYKNSIPYLAGMNLNLAPGSLTMVAGSVGMGKSSLLKSILGQLHSVSGEHSEGGPFAYVPQSPWCALGTVRENILFGKAYNPEFYEKVCFACSLETDFKLFKNGDLTWIGERGGNLSGGQKQRIALARACYAQSAITVLDSPLSAVDMHTCQHIFKHCIQELMIERGITVVLATHQVELFSHADTIIVMDEGRFKYCGPFHPPTIRKLFPNASVPDVPADGAPSDVDVQAGDNMLAVGPVSGNPNAISVYGMAFGNDGGWSLPAPTTTLTKTTSHHDLQLQIAQLEVVVDSHKGPRLKAPVEVSKAPKGGYSELIARWRWYSVVPWFFFMCFAAQSARTWSDIWISQWTQNKNAWGAPFGMGPLQKWEYFGIYVAFIGMFFFLQIWRGLWFFGMGLNATSSLHASAFNAMMRSPMAFFNLTPVGKTLNVFAKDFDTIDDVLQDNFYQIAIYSWILIYTFYVLISNVVIFAWIMIAVMVLFALVFYFYLKNAAIIKMHLGSATSTVVSHTAETLTGLAVVRAFNKEKQFLEANQVFQDAMYQAAAELNNLNHWISIRVDMLGIILVGLCVGLAVFWKEGGVSASAAGLMVSNCFQILLFLTASVTIFGDINTQIGSVANAKSLAELEPEKDIPKENAKGQAPPRWPDKGVIEFKDVVMPYNPGAPPVLKGVTFAFRPGEKIGVVGRTGAGKSTLIIAMFRLSELNEGSVTIDGIRHNSLALQQLRSKIAIIPQEPVMFKGTLRSNLDPFNNYTDAQLIEVLKKCLLGSLVDQHSKDMGLSKEVEVFGVNFSLGQQQLICLARAMLTPSKILLLDEATASLDSDTDAMVQKVLRTNFTERTIMTIAHRLDTIIDSDRILAMDKGIVAEFDSPKTLLANSKSIFSELCRNAGPDEYQRLYNAAMSAKGYQQR